MCERILSGHELISAGTFTEATRILERESVDLIVCTLLFDESRMLELLRAVKSNKKCRQIPFLCLRVLKGVMQLPMPLDDLEGASKALGAVALLDFSSYGADRDADARSAIEQYLNKQTSTH
ncbi:MAG TPA: hypothetical protein V6D17_25125 [Candidatus Obscuribacterales bacterium]